MKSAYFIFIWVWCRICFWLYMTLPLALRHKSIYGKFMLFLLGWAGMYAHSKDYDAFTNSFYFQRKFGVSHDHQ